NVTADGIGLSKDGKEVAVPTPTPAQDVAAIKYGLGYFYKIKERNDSEFVSMSEDAGADVERGVWAAGALYEKGKFSIGAIDYYSEDIINIAYAESKLEVPFADDWKLKFAGQYVDQGSVGRTSSILISSGAPKKAFWRACLCVCAMRLSSSLEEMSTTLPTSVRFVTT